MDRYRYSKTESNKFKTSRLPSLPVTSTDLYIFSREGDRLDLMANTFYNDPHLWWIIADANNLGKGSLIIPPGLQIRIPNPITDLRVYLEQIEADR
jgi:hypothetical protein